MNNRIRKRALPEGWYPEAKEDVLKQIEQWNAGSEKANGVSVIVPHAGWFFSGKIAANAIQLLKKDIDIVVVAGGHLSKDNSVLVADDQYFETPLGKIENCTELSDILLNEDYTNIDIYNDNSVEIQLPFVKYYFSKAKLLWIRIPPSYEDVKKVSRLLKDYEKKYNKTIAVIGSTDLTHYGSSYGMINHGEGKKALDWVKNINDSVFLNYIMEFKIPEAIRHSLKEHSACSSGGAALAAQFAVDSACHNSDLREYCTSYDIYPSDSFVGYAGIIYY